MTYSVRDIISRNALRAGDNMRTIDNNIIPDSVVLGPNMVVVEVDGTIVIYEENPITGEQIKHQMSMDNAQVLARFVLGE